MSNDEAAFIRSIHAQPEDDLARLVYADWLDEHGTSDQQKARSEWIRLTCWDRSKRTQKPAGKRQRMAGEPAWLRANAYRLWPNLFALYAKWPGRSETPSMSLLTGRVVVSLALEIPGEKAGEKRLDFTHVGIAAERGVTSCVTVTFLRAAVVAPAIATDEPNAELQFTGVPERCYEFGSKAVYVHRRPFLLRGLEGVWDGLDVPIGTLDEDAVKEFVQTEATFSTKPTEWQINASLTTWARKQAANPLAFGSEVVG